MSQGWWVLKPWSEKTLIEKASSVVTAAALAIIIFILVLPTPKGRDEVADQALPVAKNVGPEFSAPPPPRHNWTYRDGNQYGYEQGISDEQRAQGQVATKLLMFRFNGERDGKYQAYVRDGDYASVLECQSPCEYVKSMVFTGRGKAIRTEHMRAVSGSIASALIEDMRDGDLELYTFEREGKRYSHWFDEKTGVQRIPVSVEVSDDSRQ